MIKKVDDITGDTRDMDEMALIEMATSYLMEARLNFEGKRKDALQRVMAICQRLLG